MVDIGVGAPGRRGAALIEDADIAAHRSRRGPRQSHKWSTALGVASGSVGHGGLGHPVHPGRHGGRRRA